MLTRFSRSKIFVSLALAIYASLASAKPAAPDTGSKVKRVLLYNKIGGWTNYSASQETREIFTRLSESKGFRLDSTSDPTILTTCRVGFAAYHPALGYLVAFPKYREAPYPRSTGKACAGSRGISKTVAPTRNRRALSPMPG